MILTPDDGPFTITRLIEVAHHYHPRMADRHFESSAELSRYKTSTPEWRARSTAHDQVMANRDVWREMVRTLRDAFPDLYIADRTPWHLNQPAYAIEITSQEDGPESAVWGMVSGVAPLYFMGEVTGYRVLRHPFGPDVQPVIERLERAILARFSYHRLDHEMGMTIVPDIRVGNLWYGETTLVDALFTTVW